MFCVFGLHVGCELSANYAPDWLPGFTIRPAVSFQDSKIQTSGKNTCSVRENRSVCRSNATIQGR